MIKTIFKISFLSFLLILLSIQGSLSLETKNEDQIQHVTESQVISKSLTASPDYGKIPLYFIPNEGQVDEKTLFYAKASRYTLWLTKEGLVFDSPRRIEKENSKSLVTNSRDVNNPESFTYERDVSRLLFLNSNKNSKVVPVDLTEHKVNYFIGNDKSKWRTNVQTSKGVLYKELYPNIDLKVYGVENHIEYDFIVRSGGEVSNISFEYRDVKNTKINRQGNVVIKTNFGELEHTKPTCYQVINERKVEAEAEFENIENNTYRFKVKEYNKDYELLIDPLVLVYSTYLGGSDSDSGRAIAVDVEGAVYVTGRTYSTDFPIQNPVQGYHAGEYDVFVTKVNPSGTALIYSTYLGGSDGDRSARIAVDKEGMTYVTGTTSSTDFPILNPIQINMVGWTDSFIVKINAMGDAFIYSTYLGGNGSDGGLDIAINSEGAAYVIGYTDSSDFPTKNPIQPNYAGGWGDVFVTKIDSSGSAIVYSTYLGGSWFEEWVGSIAVDTEGAAYVTGETGSIDFPTKNPIQGNNAGGTDVFIAKINPGGNTIEYSTYLGGSDYEGGGHIAVDTEGAAYVTGNTSSSDFPIKDPIQGYHAGGWGDVFISKIDSLGSALIYSTYLGGSEDDWGGCIAVDSEGIVYVTGSTESLDFPIKAPFQGGNAGYSDGYITKINPSGAALVWSTYLGGADWDYISGLAIYSGGAAFVTGNTKSNDFPVKNPFQGSHGGGSIDAVITKLCFTYSLTITAGIGGTTDPSPEIHTYCEGTQVTITAIPDNGYKFSGWSGDATGADNPIAITMDSDKSITANFEREIIRYTLSIESGAGGTTNPAPGIYSYDEGTEVSVTAIPDSGYRFSHWSGDISSSDNPITIIMDSDKSAKANFIRQYTLSIATGVGGTTNPSPGSYIYDEGTEVNITAIPDTHYRFTGWSGEVSSTENPMTITMNSDISITANFIRIIYPPSNFTCQKVLNRSLSQAEYINVFSWQSNLNNVDILKYRIYLIEGESKSLLVELNANTFQHWHRRVEKDKKYTYAICAVNDEDREGDPAFITVQ